MYAWKIVRLENLLVADLFEVILEKLQVFVEIILITHCFCPVQQCGKRSLLVF